MKTAAFLCIAVWVALYSALPSTAGTLCANFVSGTVFEDRNNNAIQEPSEPYTSAQVRLEQNGQLYAEKLAEAEFGFVFENVTCGTYDVFVEGRYAQTIHVNDTGPSLSLSLGVPHYRFFLPVLANGQG